MPLYSDEELEKLPEFQDVDQALKKAEQVIRLSVYRHQDAAVLARIADLQNLQSLSISLADVSQLLPELSELKDLQSVYLQACSIPTFPEGLLQLRNLRSLSIRNCSLTIVPEEIARLGKLEQLHFPQNQLRQISDRIGLLANLTTLGLSYNQIKELPDSIGNLRELEWLFLDANRLRMVPASVGKLSRLKSLSLKCNELRTLPESICNLGALEHLSLEHNPFESLPRCLTTMLALEEVSIEAEKRSLFMDWSYRPSEKPVRQELANLKLFVERDSGQFSQLVAAIDECGLSVFAAAILRVAREAVCIESTVPDDYSQRGGSRFGGFPDLLDPALFPKNSDGRYWIFLAQLNLNELRPMNGFLPPSGLLSFFLDSTESLNARVLFYEGRPEMLATARHGSADEMLDPSDDYTRSPHRLRFRRFISLPYGSPAQIENDRASEIYRGLQEQFKGGDHHLNGYTFTQLESPEEQAAGELGGLPGEWVPLLQLGWDEKVGFCFWDAGTLTFTIHHEDLRRCDFSRVHVSLETS